ncbi:zinc-ribbon domain-containing protein [Anaeromyxobacter sp. Fw109-5]|uniref:zinc-ribbon domain-containing protein n=1 Tax=Anaeromyxobacter sp. (strain Fw109-5) TaxID=404589 RepID=UPI000158A86D|nr:zinc-ribbon domain-containing protein [Anaeromyxobacter sp. Fw109-5]ABS28519.1 MJ0042 family finger-like protein [Anaeromyxobacter sp. Fw109-5]
MDVRCERCKAQYVFDDEQVTPSGLAVQCTNCGHLFKVKKKELVVTVPVKPGELDRAPLPASAAARPSGGAPPRSEPREWRVRSPGGGVLTCRELTTVQKWIVEGKIAREAEISAGGDTWKRLGEIEELGSFFAVVEQAERARATPVETPRPPRVPPPPPSGFPPPALPLPPPATLARPPAARPAPAPAPRARSPVRRRGRAALWGAVAALLLVAAAAGAYGFVPGAKEKVRAGVSVVSTAIARGRPTANATPTAGVDPQAAHPERSSVAEAAERSRGTTPTATPTPTSTATATATPTEGSSASEAADRNRGTSPVEEGPAVVAALPQPGSSPAGTAVVSASAEPAAPATEAQAAQQPSRPRGPKALLAEAGRLRARGDYRGALELFGRVASDDPQNADALAGRGLCYLDLSRYAPAAASFEAALELVPAHADALLGLAEAYRAQGRDADAIRRYERYLAEHPDGEEAAVARNAIAELRR